MRLRLAALLLLTALLFLSGCFQMHLLLRLNEDGSGTIEETLLLSSMLTSFMQSADSTGAFSLIDEARLTARADSFGPGVRFLRADSIEESGMQGYRVVYAFEDVNTVRLTDDMQAFNTSSSGGGGQGLDLVTTFSYTLGELRIHSPHNDVNAEDIKPIEPERLAAKTDSIRQSIKESGPMLRGMLGSAQFSRTVVLPAAITDTDAMFAGDSTVTLAHMNFGAYLDLMEENPELAARLDLATTDAERRALLRQLDGSDGLRFEQAEEIVVRF